MQRSGLMWLGPGGFLGLRLSFCHFCLCIMLLKLRLCPPVRNRKAEAGVKEKKRAFVALPGEGGHSRLQALKTVPPIGKNCGEFYGKREKTRFSDRHQDGREHAFFCLWGNLSHQSGARRSRPERDGGLLGCCPEDSSRDKGTLIRDYSKLGKS